MHAKRLADARHPTFDVQAAKQYALAVAGEGASLRTETEAQESSHSSALQLPEEGEHGVEWGSVIHLLLRIAMENPGADLRRLATTAVREHGFDARRAETAVHTVESVMEAGIWQRALASPRRLVEVPFEILLEDVAPLPTLVRGAIDLVFEEADGWVLVDYKTDSFQGASPRFLVDKYSPQVRLYARVWERVTGENVKETGLFFVRQSLFEPVARE
jgi:ATP-dependent helicase/nuclease subunit A